jgi:hypothetical protein
VISTGSSALLRSENALEFKRFLARAFEHLLSLRDGKAAALAVFSPLDAVASFEVSFDLSVNPNTIFQLATGFDDGGTKSPLAIDFNFLEYVDAFSEIEKFRERHGA